jgi:hypothetical protein
MKLITESRLVWDRMDEKRVKRYNVWMQGICFCLIFSGISISYTVKKVCGSLEPKVIYR